MISSFVAHHRVLVGTVPPVLGGIAFLLPEGSTAYRAQYGVYAL